MKCGVFVITAVMALALARGQSTNPGGGKVGPAHIQAFLVQYPKFSPYKNDLLELYRDREGYIWFDKKGLVEYAGVLHNGLAQIAFEGISLQLPYQDKITLIFKGPKPGTNADLLMSCAYLFYYRNVFRGLDTKASAATGWHLPREKRDFSEWLDSVLAGATPVSEKPELFRQYYALRAALQRYRDMESRGGWQNIPDLKNGATLCPGDSASVIASVRARLFAEGFLSRDSKKATYDPELEKGIRTYQSRRGLEADAAIAQGLVSNLNIPVRDRIRTIAVNMERCRWIPSFLNKADEYIAVNIPSFSLHYVSAGKTAIVSNVIVGKEATKTVVFSGELTSIVFSPYWYVPQSIVEKEIRPAMKKDPAFLSKNAMEWSNGKLRQKPGPKNALGAVKFLFPNSNSIYLHDTPSKLLFERQRRAFSHGCIRVLKARELAQRITASDGGWPAEKSEAAMKMSHPTVYNLKQKIPVYIAYFTAWSAPDGEVAFFEDVYDRDARLSGFLFCE